MLPDPVLGVPEAISRSAVLARHRVSARRQRLHLCNLWSSVELELVPKSLISHGLLRKWRLRCRLSQLQEISKVALGRCQVRKDQTTFHPAFPKPILRGGGAGTASPRN